MGHLVFVGDSYCASYYGPLVEDTSVTQISAHYPTYLNLSAEWLGYNFYSYGYPGRSWWYSRNRLLKMFDSEETQTLINNGEPTFYDYTEALIFCHTDANRMNTSDARISTALLYKDKNDLSSEHDPALIKPYKLWSTCLIDGGFQIWAMEQWFKEINQRFGEKPMIHFNVSPYTVEISKQLRGVVYTTPLLNISLGEIVGTSDKVLNSLNDDQRYNHFNQHNQAAMARLIVNTLKNYEPGIRPIDLVKYDFDQPNPNARNWPGENVGSI